MISYCDSLLAYTRQHNTAQHKIVFYYYFRIHLTDKIDIKLRCTPYLLFASFFIVASIKSENNDITLRHRDMLDFN